MNNYTLQDLQYLSDQYIAFSRSLDNAPAHRVRELRPCLHAIQALITEIAAVLVGRSAVSLRVLKKSLEREAIQLKALRAELERLRQTGEALQGIINALTPIFGLF